MTSRDQATGISPSTVERPEGRMEDTERRRFLCDAITELTEIERVAVTLYYLEDLWLKEIGEVLNLSESRVSRLLKGAEHRISEHLRTREEMPSPNDANEWTMDGHDL